MHNALQQERLRSRLHGLRHSAGLVNPRDCPKLDVQWFHAVDVAKRKPDYVFTSGKDAGKPPPVPKKWNTFSQKDSQAIEAAFQSLPTEEEDNLGKTVQVSQRHDRDLGLLYANIKML